MTPFRRGRATTVSCAGPELPPDTATPGAGQATPGVSDERTGYFLLANPLSARRPPTTSSAPKPSAPASTSHMPPPDDPSWLNVPEVRSAETPSPVGSG